MRILFLTHRLPYAPNRGDRIRAFHMLQAIRQYAEVDLVSLVHDDEEASHVEGLSASGIRVWPARVSRMRNVARVPGVLLRRGALTHALLNSAAVHPALTRITAATRLDVVLAYCSGVAQFALQPPLSDLPLVIDLVDVDSEKWKALGRTARFPRSWVYRREGKYLARFEQMACREAATTLVVNEREREQLLTRVNGARIEVVENGIDLGSFSPAAVPSSEPTCVFCGVMNYAPNEEAVLWLVRFVWAEVRRRVPAAKLLIVGAHPSNQIRGLASAADGIEVTGTVPDVRTYLHRAAISVAPLQTARGIQNKVLEAIACGLPCIITPVVEAGLPREALDACRVADSPTQFAAEMIDLLGYGPARRRDIAASANLRSLTWEHRLVPLRRLLEDAVRATAKQT